MKYFRGQLIQLTDFTDGEIERFALSKLSELISYTSLEIGTHFTVLIWWRLQVAYQNLFAHFFLAHG